MAVAIANTDVSPVHTFSQLAAITIETSTGWMMRMEDVGKGAS